MMMSITLNACTLTSQVGNQKADVWLEEQIKYSRCFRVGRGTRGPNCFFHNMCDNIFYLNTYSNQKSHN